MEKALQINDLRDSIWQVVTLNLWRLAAGAVPLPGQSQANQAKPRVIQNVQHLRDAKRDKPSASSTCARLYVRHRTDVPLQGHEPWTCPPRSPTTN